MTFVQTGQDFDQLIDGLQSDIVKARHKNPFMAVDIYQKSGQVALKKLSSSAEMYLATIAGLQEDGHPEPVPVSALARELGIRAISAYQMIRKLENDLLLMYTPYKGVSLTEEGTRRAGQVLRNRRLWEVFLVEQLNLSKPSAKLIACQLEHVTPREAIDRLDLMLGNPAVAPDGRPVPQLMDKAPIIPLCLLTQLQTGEAGVVSHLQADHHSIVYFKSLGISPGRKLNVHEVTSQGDMLIETQDGRAAHLSANLAGAIWIQKMA